MLAQYQRALNQRAHTSRRAYARCNAAVSSQVVTAPPKEFISSPGPAVELDVEALQKRLEARAKAMIQLEEQEVASRTKVKFVLKQQIGLGECWKVVGKVPELGSGLPEVAPYMKWNNGDVWTYEAKVRSGTFAFKVVLRKPDGQYLWEDCKERILEVPFGEPEKVVEITGVKFK
ncbi:hypothetical protein PLESTB_000467500 [Pleodorina starrii]|uniref:CBM20 domain-containing protein n=1 Tax=Pleodorina starrii TaxID=330485 RepID=A0A9W6BF73_9CHLO|nr:hypothetical protein PLESTM_001599300 [Pleodorina starrii]GLC51116.1 hypothetical protein PLESTB_000467500 [Pleodorina starrii]GLC63474.1 hypothetical protein PLESTF_000040000 [Pleodorina starrii]